MKLMIQKMDLRFIKLKDKMDEPTTQIEFCPYCGQAVDKTFDFCPHCGKSLEVLRGISIGKQIYIYFMSLFLPPAGIVYCLRYMKSSIAQIKTVGMIALTLTMISIVLTM